jgi:hypothetical protein
MSFRPPRPLPSQVDRVLREAIRLSLRDDWSAPTAAIELRSRIDDPVAISHARALVLRARGATTPIDRRAELTMRLALGPAPAQPDAADWSLNGASSEHATPDPPELEQSSRV